MCIWASVIMSKRNGETVHTSEVAATSSCCWWNEIPSVWIDVWLLCLGIGPVASYLTSAWVMKKIIVINEVLVSRTYSKDKNCTYIYWDADTSCELENLGSHAHSVMEQASLDFERWIRKWVVRTQIFTVRGLLGRSIGKRVLDDQTLVEHSCNSAESNTTDK